ncbi:MAG: lipoyl domain-containing protein [Thermoprotei archaeon]|nr:lipoyl domain-containing protein [TACK group archaeon]
MQVEVKAPTTGPIKQVTIVEWKKKEGDHVEQGELLATANAVKVSAEIRAPASGTLKKILISAGSKANLGQTVAVIETQE